MRPFLLASTRGGTHQNEPAYQVREAQSERLRNISPYGKTEHIDVLQTDRTGKRRDVVGLGLEGVRRLAARAGDAGIVEQYHRAVVPRPSATSGSQWSIPARKCGTNTNGVPISVPKMAVGVAHAARFHDLRGRGYM